MEAKQYATEQPMSHWRNQKGNKKIHGDRNRHNDPESMDAAKAVPRGKFIVIQADIRKQENPQKP